jgi:hypothetical protein
MEFHQINLSHSAIEHNLLVAKHLEERFMTSSVETIPVSNKTLWAGRIMSALPGLLLLVDGTMKLIKPAPVIEATARLGYPESAIVGIGVAVFVSAILYLIPRTCVLGAILLTGYLGGAVASHVRAGESLFTVVFPVVFGVLIWGGLYLRDERLRVLLPLRK